MAGLAACKHEGFPMALDWSFEPNPDLGGSYYRRLEDISRALGKFEVTALPANSPAQFVAYYFGAEKLAKAIVGINGDQPAKDAFHHRVGVKLLETKSAAHDMKLNVLEAELDALFEPQWHLKQPSSAITIRNRLSHDFGPTQVSHIRQHAPRLIPIMVKFITNSDEVLRHLRALWAASRALP
jgi:hypothetical protein